MLIVWEINIQIRKKEVWPGTAGFRLRSSGQKSKNYKYM